MTLYPVTMSQLDIAERGMRTLECGAMPSKVQAR